MRIKEEKVELHENVHRRICVRDITFLAARPPSYVTFVTFFVDSLTFVYSDFILFSIKISTMNADGIYQNQFATMNSNILKIYQ